MLKTLWKKWNIRLFYGFSTKNYVGIFAKNKVFNNGKFHFFDFFSEKCTEIGKIIIPQNPVYCNKYIYI